MKAIVTTAFSLSMLITSPSHGLTPSLEASKKLPTPNEQALNLDPAKVKGLLEKCEKNIQFFKHAMVPDQYSLRALDDYSLRRKSLGEIPLETAMLKTSIPSNPSLNESKSIHLMNKIQLCDQKMLNIRQRLSEELKMNTSAEEQLVTTIQRQNNDPLKPNLILAGLLETDLILTSKKTNLEMYKNILFKSNNQDTEWILTNALSRLAIYEMQHDETKTFRMIVIIKKPGHDYRNGSGLHTGYYKLRGSYPFNIAQADGTRVKDLLVFEHVEY